jgi:prephenate dehydrogenase
MDDPGFFSKSRVLIVGLGLMGGSLALALHGKVAWLGGIDPSEEGLQQASKLNIFNALSKDISVLLPASNVIILAAPVKQNIKIIQSLPPCEVGQIIMDLSSTKRKVVAAMDSLPLSYDPIGGHPMCGSEKSSIRYARADLFSGAVFILSALPRTSELAKAFAKNLVEQIGASPLYLDPVSHDQITAEISHFPYVLSAALSLSTSPKSKSLISTGFKSTARLAGSSPAMMLDILTSNSDNVLKSISEFKLILQNFETALQNQDITQLSTLIQHANKEYNDLIS